jgi:general secretion pathway protein G
MKRQGFTLVEILIVVVILGILAAIVIPQFTQASSEAKVSSLISNLQTVRSQIQLFKIQHNDNLPGWQNTTFLQAMTGYTDMNGNIVTVGTVGACGPYLQQMPANPFIADNTTATNVTVGAGAPAGDSSSGWYFNSSTGAFNANNSGTLPDDTTRNYTSL